MRGAYKIKILDFVVAYEEKAEPLDQRAWCGTLGGFERTEIDSDPYEHA